MIKCWIGVIVALVVSGCTGIGGAPLKDSATDVSLFGTYFGPIDFVDHPQVAYPAAQGATLFRYDQVKGRDKQLIASDLVNKTEQVISSPGYAKDSYLVPVSAGAYSYIFWRPKMSSLKEGVGNTGDKMVTVSASHDGGKTFSKPTRISNAEGAFDPAVAASEQGDVYAAWPDEREGTFLAVFMNISHDGGITWKPQDIRKNVGPKGITSAREPSLLAEGSEVWLAWLEADKEFQRLYMQRSHDRGETWDAPVVINSVPYGSSMDRTRLFKLHDRLCYYWNTEYAIEGACSPDSGNTWTLNPKLVVKNQILEMKVAMDKLGAVHIAYGQRESEKTYESLFYIKAADAKTFTAPVQLNTTEYGKSSTELVDLAVRDDGAVMAVWQDKRYFRAGIRANVSRDGGQTWLASDIAISDGQGVRYGVYPSIFAGNGRFDIVWLEYAEQTMVNGQTGFKSITNLDAMQPAQEPAKPNAATLESRINSFWKSRINKDYGLTYQFFDPFFRAMSTKEKYIGSQGSFIYYDAKVEETKIEGHKATARVKFNFELPETTINGKPTSLSRRDQVVIEEWVWIDNNWHYVYKDIFNISSVPY